MRNLSRAPSYLSSQNDAGATMVEFALSIIVVLFLLGAIFDIGIGLHQYNYLNHVTTTSARDISRRLTTQSNQQTIINFLRNETAEKMRQIGSQGANTTFAFTVVNNCGMVNGRCVIQRQSLRITGRMPLRCSFICTVLPNNWSITATSQVLLESARPDAICATCIPSQNTECTGTIAPPTSSSTTT